MTGDLALLTNTQSQRQRKIDKPNRISMSIDLRIHAKKSKVLKSERASEYPTTLENTPLDEEESFTYLGSIIDKKARTQAESMSI